MDYAKSFTSEGTQIYFGNVLDCFGAYHDQIIALDWSTYPIKVVKCMALAQARRQILGALLSTSSSTEQASPHTSVEDYSFSSCSDRQQHTGVFEARYAL